MSGPVRPHADQGPSAGAIQLRPTAHDPVPSGPSGYWLQPAPATSISPALRDFARAVQLIEREGDVSSAAPLLASPALDNSPVADYARYYRGVAALRAERLDEAVALLTPVGGSAPSYVTELAALRLAETRERQGRYEEAAAAYGRALAGKPAQPDRVAYRWAVALERAGDIEGAVAAHRRVYYDYPLSPDAVTSGRALSRLNALDAAFDGRLSKEVGRADALHARRRRSTARAAYQRVAKLATGPERERAIVRVAAIDVQLKQYRAALDRLRPLAAEGSHRAEAALHVALAARGQGQIDDYKRLVGQLAATHPSSPFAEEALNGLATYLVVRDEDASAAEIFATMVNTFPAGRFAERAAWKAGWWAYRHGAMADAARYFEIGAASFPRSNFRPSWLYWSARAKEQGGDAEGATARYVLTATDYRNTYYGRLALNRLGRRQSLVTASVMERVGSIPPPPTRPIIAVLLSLGLHDQVLGETRFARRMWGDSPVLGATGALAQYRAGRLRPAINAMKRAYPQYMAAGGEALPLELLRVLFPVDHWPLLEAGAARHGLDPYLIVALAAQESTFDAGIRSSAGAIGLMQVMPATGRALARRLRIGRYATRRLTEASVNVALGTQYMADAMKRFGGAPYALAAYNAGPHRVVRWKAERPGLPDDEWIDDIPFPETQNYVKRILGTAEDYRLLYGGGLLTPPSTSASPVKLPGRVVPSQAPTTPAASTPARRRSRTRAPLGD